MTTRRTLGMLTVLLAATGVAAQDPADAPSTGQVGQVVPSTFRAYVVVDDRFPPKTEEGKSELVPDPRNRTNKMHCLVCENGLSPTVAVFVRADPKTLDATSGVVELAQAVNRIVPEYRADRLSGFVSFLLVEGGPKTVTAKGPGGADVVVELDAEYPDDEKRDVYADAIRDLAKAADTPNVPFTLAPAESKATAAWGVGPADEVTVVVYYRLRVKHRWTFPATGPTAEQVGEIIAATRTMIEDAIDPKK